MMLVAAVAANEARAAGAVGFSTWDGGVAAPALLPGESASVSGVGGLAASMAGNPALNGSAWAHTGNWWNVYLPGTSLATITIQARDDGFAPGVSVWASGATVFDGGTTGWGGEVSTAGFGTPHSFNALGVLGASGTLWMQYGQGGNMQALLGYAISGPSYTGTPTGWGETVAHGVFDMTLTDAFVSAVGGSVGAGFAQLELSNVSAGWYTFYVGGTNPALAGGLYDIQVSTVPEPSALLLCALALTGLNAARRRS
ncbi:MAG TPA: PEP-CTERM sorting domain-containing protein [Myxococcota bacterium]|nr:PEP-CTERM sorting domain-containing protein [Myxococcota bacterium]